MSAASEIISEHQQARKVATLWAYCHGVAVWPCVKCAEAWLQQMPALDQRTWKCLQSHLRLHFPAKSTQNQLR